MFIEFGRIPVEYALKKNQKWFFSSKIYEIANEFPLLKCRTDFHFTLKRNKKIY